MSVYQDGEAIQALFQEIRRLNDKIVERDAEIAALRAELARAQKDQARFLWTLPILCAQGNFGDTRALLLAAQLMRGLDGTAAIDAAIAQEAKE